METKRTVFVIIECADAKSFSAYTTEKFDGFALMGYGNSADEAKQDFIESYKEAREYYNCPELDFSFKSQDWGAVSIVICINKGGVIYETK